MVPQIYSVGLKQGSLQLRHTSRRGSSKISRLKLGHCMLNAHKSKIDHETQPNLSNKQEPQPYACQRKKQKQSFQNCSINEKERELLFKTKEQFTKKSSQYILTLTMEDVLGEQNFMHNDHKSLRETFEKSILEKLDSGRMVWTLGL